MKETITEGKALSQKTCQFFFSSDHSLLPRLQAGLFLEVVFTAWPVQSKSWSVKKAWSILDTSPISKKKMREFAQTFSRGPPHQWVEELPEPAVLLPPAQRVTVCLAAIHAAKSPWNKASNSFTVLTSTPEHTACAGFRQVWNRPCWAQGVSSAVTESTPVLISQAVAGKVTSTCQRLSVTNYKSSVGPDPEDLSKNVCL